MSKLQYETESTKDFSDEEPGHNSKRSFFVELTISLIYTLMKVALVSIVAAFTVSLSFQQLKASNAYQRIQQNIWLWQQEIIVEFTVVEAANCPQGWEEYTHYTWLGNVEGCSCSFKIGLFQYTAVLQGRCGQREFAKGCTSVPANSALPFLFWKANAHLCVKRLKNYNFYSSEGNIFNPMGFNISSCAKGTNYQIDLIDPIPCPITSIANDSSFNQSIWGLNFTYTRANNYPLVQFRISEYQFCEGLSENGKSPGRTSNYILEKYYQFECNTTDTRTILLDSQGEAGFFGNNPKIKNVTLTLPAYPQLTNQYTYHLGFVRYPAWTYSCRNSEAYNLNVTTTYLTLSEMQSTVGLLQILTLVSTFLSFVFVIYYWVSNYFYLKTKYMHGYLYLKDYEIRRINPQTNLIKNRTNQVCKSIIFEISPIASIILLVVLYFQFNSAKSWISGAYSCTDDSFIFYLKNFEQFIGGQMVVALSAVFVSLGCICLDMCYLLWRYFKGDLEDVEEELQDETASISKASTEKLTNKSIDFQLKAIHVTEQFLVDNAFPLEQKRGKVKDLNLYTFSEDEEDGKISEYSQSSKWD